MGLGANNSTVSETYDRLRNQTRQVVSLCERGIARIDGGDVYYTYLTTDLIPTMRNYLANIPDSALFPAAWVAALDAYAQTQELAPSDDFAGDYEALRSAIAEAIEAAVNSLPVTDGKLSIQSFTVEGVETVDQANDLSALKAKLEAIVTAAS